MKLVADDVQSVVIPGAGHWVAEQAPGSDAGGADRVPGPVPRRGAHGAPTADGVRRRSLDDRLRTSAHALARRGDRVAQLRAPQPRAAPRPRRRRELLDADLHQLAAHGAVRARLVAGLPRRRAGRHRGAHAGVLVRARARACPRWRRRSERSTTRSRSTTSTGSGPPSTTTTGRRSTSSTRTATFATTTSARGATRNRSASSRSCSASSASSSPSKGSAWRQRPTGTTCARLRPISATTAASTSTRPPAPRTKAATYQLPERLRLNHWGLAGRVDDRA